MDQIEKKLKEYKAQPSSAAWQRLDNKLEHNRNRNRIVRIRNLSIAASLVAIVSVCGVMSLYFKKYNPELFTKSKHYEPFAMEKLEDGDDEFYKLSTLKSLNQFYLKSGQ